MQKQPETVKGPMLLSLTRSAFNIQSTTRSVDTKSDDKYTQYSRVLTLFRTSEKATPLTTRDIQIFFAEKKTEK